MPFPTPPRVPPGPRRRSLLASAAGAALLVGCSAETGPSGTGGGPSAVQRVRARAARDSGDLAGRYDAVIAAFPALAARLAPLRAETQRHAKAFGGGAAAGPTPGATGTAGTAAPSGAGSPSASASASPAVSGAGTEKEALAQLASAERALADRRTAALVNMPGEVARLLASVAAAGAAHTYLLTEGTR